MWLRNTAVAVGEQEGVAGFEFDFLRNADAHAVLAPTLEGSRAPSGQQA